LGEIQGFVWKTGLIFNEVVIGPPIIQEILQGIREDRRIGLSAMLCWRCRFWSLWEKEPREKDAARPED
jgi:hypothetical protein